MQLLLVDDEISAIRAVENMIDFSQLGFDNYFTARSAAEAREILQKENIDILLTDIEMPQESGLDLLAWIKEQCPDIFCIYMTCYADFSYVQRAVTLGSKGYLLKPLDPDELEETLKKLVQQRKEYLEMLNNSISYQLNEQHILWDFWKDLFYDNIPSNKETIRYQLRNRNLKLNMDWTYGVVLIVSRTIEEQEYERIDRFVIHNVASELFENVVSPSTDWHDVMQFGDRAQIAICGGFDNDKIFEACRAFSEEYTKIIPNYANVRLICYVGKPVSIDLVAGEIERLLSMDSQHLEDHGVVLYSEEANLSKIDPEGKRKFERWRTLMQSGKLPKVRQELFFYLDELDVSGGLNKRQFYYFHTRYTHLLSDYAKEHKIVISRLTDKPEHAKLLENAQRNIQTMKRWIDCSLTQLMEISEHDDNIDLDPVQATLRFIDEHLAEEIDMPEIAENVHLNQDYLTRIFKRQIGSSVKSYIVTKRMEKAKLLLETTDLPIAEIAYQVGYYNYTSFNRAFKKQFDESPQAFRQNS